MQRERTAMQRERTAMQRERSAMQRERRASAARCRERVRGDRAWECFALLPPDRSI